MLYRFLSFFLGLTHYLCLFRFRNTLYQLIDFLVRRFQLTGKGVFALLALDEFLFSGVFSLDGSGGISFCLIEHLFQFLDFLHEFFGIGILCITEKRIRERTLDFFLICLTQVSERQIHRHHHIIKVNELDGRKTRILIRLNIAFLIDLDMPIINQREHIPELHFPVHFFRKVQTLGDSFLGIKELLLRDGLVVVGTVRDTGIQHCQPAQQFRMAMYTVIRVREDSILRAGPILVLYRDSSGPGPLHGGSFKIRKILLN